MSTQRSGFLRPPPSSTERAPTLDAPPRHFVRMSLFVTALVVLAAAAPSKTLGQSLINVDFGAGQASGKTGFAATGQSTNDFWNRYRHYEPKFVPGTPTVADGSLESLRLADASVSRASLSLTNAPGVWGSATGDPMFDSYVFAPNGSNIVVTLAGLEPGRYHFYLYGHADADVAGEQNSVFTLRSATNRFGPLSAAGAIGWTTSQPWRESAQFVVFRDVPVTSGEPVVIDVAAGPGGVAVLNGLQILSRGTAPPRLLIPETTPAFAGLTNLLFREIRYQGTVGTNGARFKVKLDAESRNTNQLDAVLFEGEIALLKTKLPTGWRLVKQGRQFRLFADEPGHHELEFDLVANTERAEPWTQLEFTGPPAAIAAISAEASDADTELQLRSGTPLQTDGKSAVRGMLGADRRVALRWQTLTAEITREPIVTVASKTAVHISPAAIRYTSEFKYEILQGRPSQLRIVIPSGQALARLEGDGVRDWQFTTNGRQMLLTVEYIRPLQAGSTVALNLATEQALTTLPATFEFVPPQPVNTQRESGALTLSAEDALVRVETTTSLRQVNAAETELAAFRFNTRPASLRGHVTRLQPVLTVSARAGATLEESRWLVRHDLDIGVAKAGIYSMDLTPQAGFTVSEVTGEGVANWKTDAGSLRVNFDQRVLGRRQVTVQLEQSLTNAPAELTLRPLPLAGAEKETAFIGVSSAPGLQVKTSELRNAREIPTSALPNRRDELLAFRSEQGDWQVALVVERLVPRMVAEVFNLLAIGDGLVGGSATVRFAIFNQGVQQFQLRLPAHWQNIEFTGLNLRRKDRQDDLWTISLQDKVWGGYTLVITYDYPFDPRNAALNCSGAHPLGVERETGAVAITTAGGFTIEPEPLNEPLRAIDPTLLSESDRALVSRPVLLAYRYAGDSFALTLRATRHDAAPVLDAVADRAQLTSVLSETGEMLTQASFMVKNNERQFQRFQLPPLASLWGVAVDGQPVKAERDDNWLLVALPRKADRDEAFAVDIKYAQQLGGLGRLWPRAAGLIAPKTDVPGTYAEWNLFVPPSKRVSAFGGNMTISRAAAYGVRDAWREFAAAYRGLARDYGSVLALSFAAIIFLAALVLWGRRNGIRGVAGVLAVFCALGIIAAMALPSLSKAKAKATATQAIVDSKDASTSYSLALGDKLEAAAAPAQQVAQAPTRPDTRSNRGYAVAYGAADAVTAGKPGGPVAAGIRSLAIDVPKTGQAYRFTRVLNLSGEPPTLRFSMMSAKVFGGVQAGFQLAAFIIGLGLAWREWRQPAPRALWLAAGLALALIATANLLLARQALGLALIVALPTLLVIFIAWIGWKLWPRRQTVEPEAPPLPSSLGPVPPATAGLLLWLSLGGSVCLAAPANASAPLPTTPDASVMSASYTGRTDERVAEIEAAFDIISVSTNTALMLFNKEVAIEEFTASTGGARLWRDGGQIGLLLLERGEVSVRMKLLVKVSEDTTRRRLDFQIPAALGSRLSLTLDEPNAEVEFPTAIALERSTQGTTTQLEAVLGPSDRVTLSWTPRLKRAAEAATAAFIDQATLVDVSGGALRTRSAFQYHVSQGELRQARFALPAGHTLLRVSGDRMRAWNFEGTNQAEVVVDLLKSPVSTFRLTLETERSLDRLPATLNLEPPHPLDAQRVTGSIALQVSDELALSTEPSAGLERIDNAEFTRAFGEKVELAAAWRFLRPGFELLVKADLIKPRLEAVARNHFTVAMDQVSLLAHVDYSITKAGVFNLRLQLPPSARLESVKCPELQAWIEQGEGRDRVLEVTLAKRALGNVRLEMRLVQPLTNLPPSLELTGVHPIGVDKFSAFVSVAADTGVGVKTAGLAGLTEIPASVLAKMRLELDGGGSAVAPGPGWLAFKTAADPARGGAPWSLTLTTEAIDAWVRAETMTIVTVGETLITGRTVVRYEIQNAPIKEFRFNTPPAWQNVELSGTGIRRQDQTNDQWRVELQNRVHGEYRLTLHWELPGSTATNNLAFSGVEVQNCERETGAVSFLTSSPLQLAPARTGDMTRIDVRELPTWVREPALADHLNSAALTFRYLRPGWRLALDVRRFGEAALLQALIERARLQTVVADDGQAITHMKLSILNNGRQHLQVTLPPGAAVWSAFVGGQPVRPAAKEGSLLLPLENLGNGVAISIDVTYVSSGDFPKNKGRVELASPRFDIPLKDALWEVFLPADYRYDHFGGSMTHAPASLDPTATVFTLAEYKRQEAANTAGFEARAGDLIRRARSEIATGNFYDTANQLMRLKSRAPQSAAAARELTELEQDVSRAQSSNLLLAQQDLNFRNVARFGAFEGRQSLDPNQPQAASVQYDSATAAQQVKQLQKAQVVAAAHVAPLRVNLPTHGVRHAFVQLLQTDVNKPLTVALTAKNDRRLGWFTASVLWVGGFAVLWLAAAVAVSRRTQPNTPVS